MKYLHDLDLYEDPRTGDLSRADGALYCPKLNPYADIAPNGCMFRWNDHNELETARWLNSRREMHVVWSADDIRVCAQDNDMPAPSAEQCAEILYALRAEHNAELGITWEGIYAKLEALV